MIKNGNEIRITEEEARTCLLDGKKFDSNRKMIWYVRKTYHINFEQYITKTYYNETRPVCLNTGKPLRFKAHKLGPWFSNYAQNCFPRKPHSDESKKKIKEGCERTSMKKFGVKNVFETDWCKEKSKETMLKKHGVENIMQTEEMRQKSKETLNSLEAYNKARKTTLERYGTDFYRKSLKHKLEVRKNNFERVYTNWDGFLKMLSDNTYDKIKCLGSFEDVINNKPLKFECIVCKTSWDEIYITSPECVNCKEKFLNARSQTESSLMKWLKSSTILPFDVNKRFKINEKVYEADILIPDKNVIIELNGLFWHSERAGKGRTYHLDKLNSFESLGFNVLQIFEDELLFKGDIVRNKILHKLGLNQNLPKIYARQCEIKKIKNKISNVLLERTHLQGGTNASHCYGAFYKDELIAVMTFSSLRNIMGNKKKNDNEYEMVRFSTSDQYRVVGIASRLLSFFIRDKAPSKIISYADRRWSTKNSLYSKIGFKLIGETQPNYWYVKKYKREYRFNYTKQKLIKMGCDPAKTEWENMQLNGFDRIWDCGHLKYEWVKS